MNELKKYILGITQNKDFNSFVIVTWAFAIFTAVNHFLPELITGEIQASFGALLFAFLFNRLRQVTKDE